MCQVISVFACFCYFFPNQSSYICVSFALSRSTYLYLHISHLCRNVYIQQSTELHVFQKPLRRLALSICSLLS